MNNRINRIIFAFAAAVILGACEDSNFTALDGLPETANDANLTRESPHLGGNLGAAVIVVGMDLVTDTSGTDLSDSVQVYADRVEMSARLEWRGYHANHRVCTGLKFDDDIFFAVNSAGSHDFESQISAYPTHIVQPRDTTHQYVNGDGEKADTTYSVDEHCTFYPNFDHIDGGSFTAWTYDSRAGAGPNRWSERRFSWDALPVDDRDITIDALSN